MNEFGTVEAALKAAGPRDWIVWNKDIDMWEVISPSDPRATELEALYGRSEP